MTISQGKKISLPKLSDLREESCSLLDLSNWKLGDDRVDALP